MEKIDIVLWIIGGGFALMVVMWNSLSSNMKELNNKIDDVNLTVNKKIDDVNSSLSRKIDDTNSKLADIDKRLYGVETLLHMKDCCVLKQDTNLKKVE